MLNLKNCKKTGEQKSFTNRERFFYAHFITSFKKFAQVRKNGQSTLEYFIIITLVIVITAFGVSQFFNRSKENTEVIFNKAATRITQTVDPQMRLTGCGTGRCCVGADCWPFAPNFSGVITFPQGSIPASGGEITMTSAEWFALTGINLGPGRYCYKFASIENTCCDLGCKPCKRRTCSVPKILLTITG